jgi:hypothetical protein
MEKIGLIFCAFNVEEYVRDSLNPWVELKKQFDISIVAVSLPFEEYQNENIKEDATTDILEFEYLTSKKIDRLIESPRFIKEYDARNLAAQELLNNGCSHIVLWDGDEVATVEQLINIINYVDVNRWYAWFNFSYKNFVFDKKTYLVNPFTPPRWFRVETNGYRFERIYFDNDAMYVGIFNHLNSFQKREISYKELPSKVIPTRIAWIDHYTWLNDERSKAKVFYQQKRWGKGGCSFAWGQKGLEFNKEFYFKNAMEIPHFQTE